MHKLTIIGQEPGIDKRILQTLQWKEKEDTVLKDLGLSNSFSAYILPSLIYVESGGDPGVDTNYASGLCQISKGAASDMVKKMGITKPLNLKNPEVNIMLSSEYLEHLLSVYQDKSLALWAYHLGQDNMNLAIKTYCMENLGMQPKKIDEILSTYDYQKNQTGTAKLVQTFKGNPKEINFINLVNSEQVKNALIAKDAFHDKTAFYVPRIAAAYDILQEFEQKHKNDKNLPDTIRIAFGQAIEDNRPSDRVELRHTQ